MTGGHPVRRLDPEEIEGLRVFSAATLHEAQGQAGAMSTAIKPIYSGMRLCGSALTIEGHPGDNLAIHEAVALAWPCDVLVVDYKGQEEFGPFGDILATACLERGLAGLVIDGCVRDGAVMRDMGFPVFARGLNMKGTQKARRGAIGGPISCGGVAVNSGDVVVGDDDGVVIVPHDAVAVTIKAAQEREDKEAALRDRLHEGALTVDLLGLRPLLRAGG